MTRIGLFASVAMLGMSLGAGQAARAADMAAHTMAVKVPPAAPVPAAPSWTGFYVGLGGGYGWSDPTVTFSPANNIASSVALGSTDFFATGPITAPSANFNTRGKFGGVDAGYNLQINHNWLVGLEADFSASGIKGDGSSQFLFSIPAFAISQPAAIDVSRKVSWFGTVRPRVGWLANDNLLIYGTGGFAYGRVSDSVNYNTKDLNLALGDLSTFICGPTNVPGSCFPAQSTRIVMGWTAGGGTEYRLPGTNVTIFAQYLYMHLGGSGVVNAVNIATRPAPFGPPASFAATFTGTEFQTVKVGLNLKL